MGLSRMCRGRASRCKLHSSHQGGPSRYQTVSRTDDLRSRYPCSSPHSHAHPPPWARMLSCPILQVFVENIFRIEFDAVILANLPALLQQPHGLVRVSAIMV